MKGARFHCLHCAFNAAESRDQKNYRVIGRKTGKTFRLGDRINVRIKKTDIDRRLIDLVFATDYDADAIQVKDSTRKKDKRSGSKNRRK